LTEIFGQLAALADYLTIWLAGYLSVCLSGWHINFTCLGHNEKRFYIARPPVVVYNQVKCAHSYKEKRKKEKQLELGISQ